MKDTVVLEIGARSLMEPVQLLHVKSLVESHFPNIRTSVQDPEIATSTPAKTFLEKAFLLHELFSVNEHAGKANHRSRHLYDLERMMDMPFAVAAINDNDLWESIQHHRSIYTAVEKRGLRQRFAQRDSAGSACQCDSRMGDGLQRHVPNNDLWRKVAI